MKNRLFVLFLGLFLVFCISAASAAKGAIWTTRIDCGNETQNVNQYYIGEKVYIKGSGFAFGEYNWNIIGLPSSCDDSNVPVAGGTFIVNSDTFCFEAYTVADNDCGVYKAEFNGKHDNYSVNEMPLIPEFGALAGITAIAGCMVIFLFVRRKEN